MVVLGSLSIRVNVLDSIQHSASTAWRTIQGNKRRDGIVAIGGVHRITGIVVVRGVEGIVGRISLCGVQRVVRCVETGRAEDVVVAFVFLGEAGFGGCRGDGEQQRQQKEEDDPHGEPPKSGTTSRLS